MKKIRYVLLIILIAFASLISWGVLEYYYLNYKKMAEPVWGQLQKAQDDPETIEESIQRFIDDHLADAGAHTGASESLETHKDQDIIDHPAGSVLADKDSMSEFIIKDDLKSLDGWNKTGDITNTNWPGTDFYVEWGVTNQSSMFVQSTVPAAFFHTDFDMTFQVTEKFDLSSALYEAWAGIAIDTILPADGFGFVFEDGVTKAVFAIASTRVFSSAITNDETVEHVYRAQYNATTQEAKFYIDGVLKATLSKPVGTGNLDVGGSIGIKLTQVNDGNLRIGGVTMARGI